VAHVLASVLSVGFPSALFAKTGVAPSNLKGCVLQSADQSKVIGIYEIPQQKNRDFKLVAPYVVAPYGGVKVGDIYYAAQIQEFYGNVLYMVEKWDTNTWESIDQQYTGSPTIMASDLAYDSTTGNVYGCFYNEDRSGWNFGIADYDNLNSNTICHLSTGWNALACTKEGQLYAIDRKGDLLKVNKETGETDKIGSTGLTPKNLSSGAIDPETGRFFYAVHSNEEAALYEIDLSTGIAEWLMDYENGEEITGMWVDKPLASPTAPAPVGKLEADFVKASLTGKVNFMMPETLYNGTPASGMFSWRIMFNGQEMKSGQAAPATRVSEEMTVKEPGVYDITVVAANDAGDSAPESLQLFIGPGTPVMTSATLKRDGQDFVISWSPVTESSDGGYIETEVADYTVTRYPDAKVIAKTGNTVVYDPVAEPEDLTTYHYTVRAVVNGVASEPAVTNNIALGAVTPPYSPDLKDVIQFDSFTVSDANKDGIVWFPDSETGCARLLNNSQLAADDWLVTPALKLEEGKLYRLEFKVFGQSANYPERYEVKMGSKADATSMTEVLVAPEIVKCKSDNPVYKSIYISAQSTGKYHIGFHGISDKDMFALFIGDIRLSEGMSPKTPDAVTELVVTPDINGDLKASISLVAPDTDIAGNGLTLLDSVELLRDGKTVKKWGNPVPGSRLEFEDIVEHSGIYNYTAFAINAEGRSVACETSRFIGMNVPDAVTDLTVREDFSNPGVVTLSWVAPEKDIAGNPVNQSNMTYTVSIYDEESGKHMPVATDIADLTYTYTAVEPGEKQKLIEWAVSAVASGNVSKQALVMGFAGTPFDAPYAESFANGVMVEDMLVETSAPDAYGMIIDDSRFSDIKSYDDDNGFLGLTGFKGNIISLNTGKVDIPAVNPGFMYHVFNLNDPIYNGDALSVEINDGNGWMPLETVNIKDLPRAGWNRRYIMLGDYSGKPVQIRFNAQTNSFSTVYIDNLLIGTLPESDLAVSAVTAPARVHADEPFTISIDVENFGTADVNPTDYSVKLFANGEEVDSKPGKRIRSCGLSQIEFETSLGVISPETTEFQVTLDFDDDANPSDNASSVVTIERVLPLHPVVRNLSGSHENGVNKITWEMPDMSLGSPAECPESFETGTPFAVNTFKDWTFVDGDDAPTHPVQDLELPNQGGKMAYVIVDSSFEGLNETWAAADGVKYLASFCAKGKPNDDWAISPLLYGGAQTVSFQAKTYSNRYGLETFEFLYSATGNDVSDFVALGEPQAVPFDAWTTYKYSLPSGARYFAIRCTSEDRFIFMVDDVKFYPASSVNIPQLIGYNVYRDGELLTSSPLQQTEFKEDSDNADVTYDVTASYDLGESAPMRICLNPGAIEDVYDLNVRISGGDGMVSIVGNEGNGATVITIDGKVVFNGICHAEERISASAGVYVVKAGKSIVKVIVR